ncbi:MAG: VacJ family lipoprotein [Erythrobacter sp.]|jgi:phospholipid-binding lipoprotein MlaA|uniref:MlaA family lipoprotein n=1 Tax=Erythrobacter sp. TaxID=1042 RepID=UPI002B4672A9|nr:VacJ family lipoprotein [Erythrobacter sp.]WRH69723.1 MAG: VacJ family lipoprotein [Erythrobacter sp.]
MPSLVFLTVSQPLMSAALAVQGAPAPAPAVEVAAWSLAEAPPPPEQPAPEEPQDAPQDENGEIVVEGEYGPPAGDPAEKFNAQSYRITNAVDQAVIEPVAYAYRDGLPTPIRDGLGNVVKNLGEPSNALNFLLQGKVGKAFETLGRLAINSTLGLGGLIDVAGKPGIGLPYRRNGFANTAGFYGVGPGPYLYLPVTGATTLRDIIGSTLDQALLPFAVGKPFSQPAYAVTYFVVNGLDQRLEVDAELKDIAASDDPYAMRRDTYLAKRAREIAELKGETVPEPEAAPPPAPAPAPDTPPLSLIEQVQLTARSGVATR